MIAPQTPQEVHSFTPAEVVMLAIQMFCFAAILVFTAAIFRLGETGYIAFGLLGALGIHLSTRPTRGEILLALVFAVAFAAIYFLLHGKVGDYWGVAVGTVGGFLGMGSLQLLACKWIVAPQEAKPRHFEILRESVLIPVLCICSVAAVTMDIRWTPLTYDRLLYAFDSKFGGPPSWVVGRLLRAHPWLFLASMYAYNSLPLAMAGSMWLRWKDRQSRVRIPADLLWMAATLGAVGFLLYHVVPAAGPIHLFPHQFPYGVPELQGLSTDPAPLPEFPRNAMPSLHVAWMLLLFWNTLRRAWWIRLISTVYLVLTVLATLGLGEHYLADLLVSAPLVLAVQAACTRIAARERWIVCGAGTILTLTWLIALRTGAALRIPSGPVLWSVAAMTLVVSTIAAGLLDQAGQTEAALDA